MEINNRLIESQSGIMSSYYDYDINIKYIPSIGEKMFILYL